MRGAPLFLRRRRRDLNEATSRVSHPLREDLGVEHCVDHCALPVAGPATRRAVRNHKTRQDSHAYRPKKTTFMWLRPSISRIVATEPRSDSVSSTTDEGTSDSRFSRSSARPTISHYRTRLSSFKHPTVVASPPELLGQVLTSQVKC